MDGRGVTKNHIEFPMLGKGNFTEHVADIGLEVVRNLNTDTIIYAGTDEVSFIFKDPRQLIRAFDLDNNASNLCVLFAQRFVERFWEYKKVYFKATIFNIEQSDISKWISFRKEVNENVALMYIAKERLPKEIYSNADRNEVVKVLKDNNLINKENEDLRKGYIRVNDTAAAYLDFTLNNIIFS